MDSQLVSAATLQAFMNRIKIYEIGLYQIIRLICYKMCGYYKDLNATQIKSYEYLLTYRYSYRFSMSCASHMDSKQIDMMLKAIKVRDCEYFSPHDVVELRGEYIGLYYRIKMAGITCAGMSSSLQFIARFCLVEQIDCFLSLTNLGISPPYSYNISRYYYNKKKIDEIIEFKIKDKFRDELLLKATLDDK